MSGIAGQIRLHGEIVARRDLERMVNALHRHGPERSNFVIAGSVGLAHALMRMTPEDQFCGQPLRGASGAILVADLRLDNRDDVLAATGVSKLEAAAWEDARVLLAAWEKFGDAVWPTLRGPFAVAVWDPRVRILTLARDHLGLNVAFWLRNERQFAFASMPNGLFALPEVPRELSEEKFADFLVLNHADHATTIYRNIFRILPAHVVAIKADDGSMEQRRYWSPADIKPIHLSSDQAYADGLRERLDVAVRRQIRSAYPIGSQLTGGLDSSSVSALAARALGERNQRLAAFTQVPRKGFDGAVPEGSYADETPYVDAISRALGNIDVSYVHNDDCDDFAELERFFVVLEGPVRNPTSLGWMLAIARLARAQGVRVLLSGLYGNSTISWDGWSQVVDQLRHGRLVTATRQWRLFYRRSPYSRWVSFYKLIVEPLIPVQVDNWVERWRNPPWQRHAAIRSDFAADMRVSERAAKFGHDFLYRPRSGEQMAALMPVDYVGDWMAAEKALTGVEMRFPTADIDVVSFCFGVPPEQYLVEDIDRSLIRRAMWGLLPQTVLSNRLKGAQSVDWYEKLERRRNEIATDIVALSTSPLARRTIDLERLDRAIKSWPTGAWHSRGIVEEYHFARTRGIAAGRFLRWMESANR
jgi:asparagine synthase (glutamine-hydrolysing)